MNKPTEPVKSPKRGVILAGLAGAAAAVAALYVIAGPNGNIASAHSCTAALSAAAAANNGARWNPQGAIYYWLAHRHWRNLGGAN